MYTLLHSLQVVTSKSKGKIFSDFFVFERANTSIQHGHVRFMKSDSKCIHNVKKRFTFYINPVLLNCIFIK